MNETEQELKIIIDSGLTLGKKLFEAKSTYDLKIICDEKTFECHRNVLCCQSDVFETMLLGNMAEAKSGIVKIDDFKAEVIETLLYFLYHEEVKDTKMINTELKFIYSKKATKFLRNLPLTFDRMYCSQKLGEDFAKFLWPSQNI